VSGEGSDLGPEATLPAAIVAALPEPRARDSVTEVGGGQGTGGGASAPGWVIRSASVSRALRELAELADVHIDPARARGVVDSLERRAHRTGRGAGDCAAMLVEALAEVGLRPGVERLTLAELRDRFRQPSLPRVVFPRAESGGPPILVEGLAGRRLKARQLVGDDDSNELRLDDAALCKALGHEDGAILEWVAATPAAPLDAMVDPRVKHAHDVEHAGAHHFGGHNDGHGDHHPHGPRPLTRLRALLRLERDDVWVVLVYAVAVGLLSLAMPIAVQSLVSTVAFGTLLQPLVVLTVLLAGVLSFSSVLQALKFRVVEAIQQRLFVRVALDVAYRLPRTRADALDRTYAPELVNRFFDVLTVQKTVNNFLLDGLTLVLSILIGMLVLAFYHPLLLAFDVVLILGMVAVVTPLGRGGQRTAIAESLAKYRVAAWLEEIARHGETFRSRHGATYAAARADVLSQAYLAARRANFQIVFRQYAGVLFLQVLATASLLGLGGWLVIERQLTLGQLVAAEIIVASVVSSLSKLGKKLDSFYDLVAAMDKIGHLVDLPLERASGSGTLAGLEGPAAVRVEGVRIAYPGGGREIVLPDLTLAPGDRVAVVGPDGSGKTTFAEILFGLREPTAGVASLDGVEVREVAPAELREHVARVCTEQAEVIEGTVLDNVALGRPGIGHREAHDALAAVGLDERVRQLPRGLDTWLSATGVPLSGSDLRRLGVARAIAGRPRLLVVDGGVAGLGPRAREVVIATLLDNEAPWTLLVLANEDDPLVGRCDRVIAMRPPERPALHVLGGAA
jgi:ABC-type bacteriocin/lantibiotic exporter with double-glycine peptidase domain